MTIQVVLVFALTLSNLVEIITNDDPKVNDENNISPISTDIIESMTSIYVSGVIVLLCTGIFMFFNVPLLFVQIGNFLSNKSTNERFSK